MKTNTVSTRRRFFWKAGAALSIPLTVGAASAAAADTDGGDSLKARLREFDDINGIRALQQQLAQHINAGSADRAVELFITPGDAGGLAGLSHLASADFGEQDVVKLDHDGRTASVETHCTVETAIPIDASGTLVEMAHLQGDGVVRRTEARILEAEFIKHRGAWKFRRLTFRSA